MRRYVLGLWSWTENAHISALHSSANEFLRSSFENESIDCDPHLLQDGKNMQWNQEAIQYLLRTIASAENLSLDTYIQMDHCHSYRHWKQRSRKGEEKSQLPTRPSIKESFGEPRHVLRVMRVFSAWPRTRPRRHVATVASCIAELNFRGSTMSFKTYFIRNKTWLPLAALRHVPFRVSRHSTDL